MPFYEVIYESGACSVMCCDSDDEALEGISEQHRRALNGEAGGPEGRAAERIKRVLRYERHPNDYNQEQAVDVKEVTALVKEAENVPHLLDSIREFAHPMVPSGPHESNFKMEEETELSASKWGGE